VEELERRRVLRRGAGREDEDAGADRGATKNCSEERFVHRTLRWRDGLLSVL